MTVSLNNLKPTPRSRRRRKRVGRGNASGHGTYSTRGLKGQRSRSGGKGGLKRKGMKSILLNAPKLRGFKSLQSKKYIINIENLEKNFEDNDKVSPQTLLKKQLIGKIKRGVKILGEGELNKKLIIEGCDLSKSAKEKIQKAGGEVIKIQERPSTKPGAGKKKRTK